MATNGISHQLKTGGRRGSIAQIPEEVARTLKLVVTPSGALPQLPLPEEVSEDYVNCKLAKLKKIHPVCFLDIPWESAGTLINFI